MNDIQPIITAYTTMRAGGIESGAAFRELFAHISALDSRTRDQLIERLREWETQRGVPFGDQSLEMPTKPVKPIKPITRVQPVELKNCPHCGKSNRKDEPICYSCGGLLHDEVPRNATTVFEDNEQETAYFGSDYTLILIVKGTKKTARIHPQHFKREVVLGRSGSAMSPDIDLNYQGGAELGVSRVHLGMNYDEKNNALTISDMGSANGTFVNGLRLHPREVRVLRHGDELRLARLSLMVYFQKPESQSQ